MKSTDDPATRHLAHSVEAPRCKPTVHIFVPGAEYCLCGKRSWVDEVASFRIDAVTK